MDGFFFHGKPVSFKWMIWGCPYFWKHPCDLCVCNTPFIHIAIPTLCNCMEQMRFSVCLLDMDVYVCSYLHRCCVYIYFQSLTCADPFQKPQRFPVWEDHSHTFKGNMLVALGEYPSNCSQNILSPCCAV